MLTVPTKFGQMQKRSAVEPVFLMIITLDDNSKFRYSDRPLDITDAYGTWHFHPVIKDWGTFQFRIDPFSKASSVNNVKLKLLNAPYLRDSGGWQSASDQLSAVDYINRVADIYLGFTGMTNLSDFLKIFSGLVQPIKDMKPEGFSLELIDNSGKYHALIPDNVGYEGRKYPLVWGNHALSDCQRGTVVEGITGPMTQVIFSDHVLKAISNVWLLDTNLNALAKLDPGDYTVYLNSGGRSIITISFADAPVAWAYLYPDFVEVANSLSYPGFPFINGALVNDRDSDTFCQVKAPPEEQSYPPPCTGTLKGFFSQGLSDAGDILQVFLEINYSHSNDDRTDEAKASYQAGGTPPEINLQVNGGDIWNSLDITSYFAGQARDWSTLGSSDSGQTLNRFLQIFYDVSNAGGVQPEVEVGKMREFRLKIKYNPKLSDKTRYFAECEGRAFSSWIDDWYRSNGFNQGQLIQNPAYIIESILRDVLGVYGGEDYGIDHAAFDACGALLSTWNMAIVIKEVAWSKDIIEEVCRQAKLNFFFDSNSMASLAIIDAGTPSEVDTLMARLLQRTTPSLSKGEVNRLTNQAEVLFRPLPDSGFDGLATAENTGSQMTYNIIKKINANTAGIASASVAQALANHYCGSSGFWKSLRETFAFRVPGFEKVHWQLGDIIKPDSSVDTIITLFGQTWGTAKMMIISKTIDPKGANFEMMKIN